MASRRAERARLSGDYMIVGTGMDVAEVDRIKRSIERFGSRFLERVFTADEIRYCDTKANREELRMAASLPEEAAMKALGTGWNRGVRWRDVEVRRMPGERPTVHFHGKGAEFFHKLGATRAHLSITHTTQLAVAQVILETE